MLHHIITGIFVYGLHFLKVGLQPQLLRARVDHAVHFAAFVAEDAVVLLRVDGAVEDALLDVLGHYQLDVLQLVGAQFGFQVTQLDVLLNGPDFPHHHAEHCRLESFYDVERPVVLETFGLFWIRYYTILRINITHSYCIHQLEIRE